MEVLSRCFHRCRSTDLHDVRGESSVEPDPVTRGNDADARHAAEDRRANPSPLVAEVMRVHLSAEDGQDERQHGQQVDLSPELQTQERDGLRRSPLRSTEGRGEANRWGNPTHSVAVEGVEDPGDVAAQDADGDAGVVQREPAAAGGLRSVAREQVVPHGTQHAHLRCKHKPAFTDQKGQRKSYLYY